MEMCYDGTLVMPNHFVEIESEEMEYLEGGNPYAMVAAMVAAGWGVMNIGRQCGEYVYNNGGTRNGLMTNSFKVAGALLTGGLPGATLFNIGLDNGWVAASKK